MTEIGPAAAAARMAAQLLSGCPADSAEAVVRRLLAVQAQDPRGYRLALRPRSAGLSAADVDAALTERRSLVVTWLNRGTLHLVLAEDYRWLHQLTAPRLVAANVRRLGQEGVSPAAADSGVECIMRDLAGGPRTRAELRAALDAAGVLTAGQALVHLLVAASLRHPVVRGPVRDGEQCFVDAATWLPPTPELDRDEALGRLAGRYLAGHGPATDADLATWAGIGLGDARRGLAVIASQVRNSADGLVDLPDRAPATALPPPRLLGPYDPILHGWRDRRFVTGSHTAIVTSNGLFRPVALVGGRAVATWSLNGDRLVLHPLEAIEPADLDALRQDADAVRRYLGRAAMTVSVDARPG